MKSFVWLTIFLFLAGIASAAERPAVILASSETPQMIVTGPKNVDPALLAEAIQAAKDSFTPELVKTIKEAASNQEVWDKAIRNPEGFLAEKGFALRDRSVRLFEGPFSEGPFTVWDPDTSGCWPGLVPVKVEHWVETCLRRMEYVQCTKDLTTGRYVCVKYSVCVLPIWEIQTTTECALIGATVLP
jgi:hypothetical protein